MALACLFFVSASQACASRPLAAARGNREPPAADRPHAEDRHPVASQPSLLHADGTRWVDEAGEKVSLRGINLGNWLSMEMWMLDPGPNPLGPDINDQCGLEATLARRFGKAEKERLLRVFRDSWITSREWDVIADARFNLVRLPFPYDIIEDDEHPMTLRAEPWLYLDRAVAQAKARGIYLILDLHGAAGRQGWEQHSGCAGKNELWASESNRARTVWLWQELARHYEDEPTIAGYGLLNEPWGTDAVTLRDFMLEIYRAIRAVDRKHVVVLPDAREGFAFYGVPAEQGLSNVAFESHKYPGYFGWGTPSYETHRDWLSCGEDGLTGVCDWHARLTAANVPFLLGETQPWANLGELGGEITRATFDRYNQLGWAVTAWSLKTTSYAGGIQTPRGAGTWGLMTNTGAVCGDGVNGVLSPIDVNSASRQEIEGFFASFASLDYVVNSWVMASMNREAAPGLFANVPRRPTELALEMGEHGASLTWRASPGSIRGYRVYRSSSPCVGFTVRGTSTSPRFTDASVEPDEIYYYYVTSCTTTDESRRSNLVASGQEKERHLDNPVAVTSGAGSTARLVHDAAKGKPVVRLDVHSQGRVEESDASFEFAAIDFSRHAGLAFDVFDTVGANTVQVSLTDSLGRSWSVWTEGKSVRDRWTTLSVGFADSANLTTFDLGNVVSISVAEWHEGTYLFADFRLAPFVSIQPRSEESGRAE